MAYAAFPYIGKRTSNQAYVGIAERDRFRHAYVIGKPGMGKSTLLEHMAIQDIANGEGLAFIDPHGMSAEFILDHIPTHRTGDVVYINPADRDWPVAINLVDTVPDARRPAVSSSIVAAFQHLFTNSWGPRLHQILYNSVAALMDAQNTSILSVPEMLANPDYRA